MVLEGNVKKNEPKEPYKLNESVFEQYLQKLFQNEDAELNEMSHSLRNIYEKDKKNLGFKPKINCHGKERGQPVLESEKKKQKRAGPILFDVLNLMEERKQKKIDMEKKLKKRFVK